MIFYITFVVCCFNLIPSVISKPEIDKHEEIKQLKLRIIQLNKQKDEISKQVNIDDDECKPLLDPIQKKRMAIEQKTGLLSKKLDELSQDYTEKEMEITKLEHRTLNQARTTSKTTLEYTKILQESEYQQLLVLEQRLESEIAHAIHKATNLVELCEDRLKDEQKLIEEYINVYMQVGSDVQTFQEQLSILENELRELRKE